MIKVAPVLWEWVTCCKCVLCAVALPTAVWHIFPHWRILTFTVLGFLNYFEMTNKIQIVFAAILCLTVHRTYVIYISILYTSVYFRNLKNNVDYFHGLSQHRHQETKNNNVYGARVWVFWFVFFHSLFLLSSFSSFVSLGLIISKVLSHCLYWFWCHLFNFEQPFLN